VKLTCTSGLADERGVGNRRHTRSVVEGELSRSWFPPCRSVAPLTRLFCFNDSPTSRLSCILTSLLTSPSPRRARRCFSFKCLREVSCSSRLLRIALVSDLKLILSLLRPTPFRGPLSSQEHEDPRRPYLRALRQQCEVSPFRLISLSSFALRSSSSTRPDSSSSPLFLLRSTQIRSSTRLPPSPPLEVQLRLHGERELKEHLFSILVASRPSFSCIIVARLSSLIV